MCEQWLGKDGVPFNFYLWMWKENKDDMHNCNAMSQNDKLIVPLIVTKLKLERIPEKLQ